MFKTCKCIKENLVCIITGFTFKMGSEIRNGDLFKCNDHKTLVICGINPNPQINAKEVHIQGSFNGLLCEANGPWLRTFEGTIQLNKVGKEYITKWNKEVLEWENGH